MKRFRLVSLLLALALALGLTASAAGQTGSITVHFAIKGTPVPGTSFSAYRVADADDAGSLTPVPPYSGYPVALKDAAWKDLADTYAGYTRRDQLTASASGVTDEKGELTFSGLTPGLYLILGERVIFDGGSYQPAPLLVDIPDRSDTPMRFDVSAEVKTEIKPPVGTTVTRKVLKIWDDKGSESARPKQVTVQLLCDGKLFDTVTLSADNDWRYTWDELDDAYDWQVVEKELSDYTVRVGRSGATFTVTNTRVTPVTPVKPTPGKPTLPQTGQLWWPVPLLILVGLGLLFAGLRQRRSKHEK